MAAVLGAAARCQHASAHLIGAGGKNSSARVSIFQSKSQPTGKPKPFLCGWPHIKACQLGSQRLGKQHRDHARELECTYMHVVASVFSVALVNKAIEQSTDILVEGQRHAKTVRMRLLFPLPLAFMGLRR